MQDPARGRSEVGQFPSSLRKLLRDLVCFALADFRSTVYLCIIITVSSSSIPAAVKTRDNDDRLWQAAVRCP